MVDARVDIVGLGLAVDQASQAGISALCGCRWLGHYGLPTAVRQGLVARWPIALDLDSVLHADLPLGFVFRLGDAIHRAVAQFGRVCLAVSGHPVAANPSTAWLGMYLRQRGIPVIIHPAPNALDHFMAATGIDLVEHGISLVDALRWLARREDPAGRAIAIWNAGYLDAQQRAELIVRLLRRFNPEHPVRLFRMVGTQPNLRSWPMLPAAAWLAGLDAETTLFVF